MSYETLFHNALSLHEAGQLDEAEGLYRRILETAPNQPDVLNLLGLIAQDKGLQDEAISLFSQAISEKENNPVFYYNLAFSYKLAKRYREALEAFARALSLDPTIKEAFNEIGLLYQLLGDYEKANQNFQYALKLDQNFASAKINKAFNLSYTNIRQAVDELEKLCSKYQDEPLLWFCLAQLYMKTQNWPKAWTAASKTKELAPTSDEVRVMLGQLSLLENEVQNAKIYFSKAELLNPSNIAAILNLADIYSRENSFDEAEKRYKRILELDNKNFEAHNNYAEMLYRAHRTAEALEEYRQAVIINPNSAAVSNNLALVLKDLQEYDEAANLLLNALKLSPEIEEISINLSETIALLARTQVQKAKSYAKRWLELCPNNIFAQKQIATLQGEYFENNHLYSERLFDNFADNYELVMQNLGYSAALAVGRIVGNEQAVIVDLGCGTGLMGKVLKNPQRTLIGVDVSQKMLDKAKDKNFYSKLIKDDIVHYLTFNHDFDVAIMADVVGYLQNFETVIQLLRKKIIVFTIETSKENRYEVDNSGRYKYNPDYIEKLLQENGFKSIYREDIVLRKEAGENVCGVIFRGE